jgi:hypothetical protein
MCDVLTCIKWLDTMAASDGRMKGPRVRPAPKTTRAVGGRLIGAKQGRQRKPTSRQTRISKASAIDRHKSQRPPRWDPKAGQKALDQRRAFVRAAPPAFPPAATMKCIAYKPLARGSMLASRT